MKILITGATGSLGAYLTRYFSNKSHKIIASGRVDNPPSSLLQYARYIKADITEKCNFPEVDICIHTAARSDDKASRNELYAPNVEGSRNVIKATRTCKKFIHISSSSIYLPHSEPITEDMAGKQNNKELSLYGMSKLMSEEVVLGENKNDSCFILRPRALYGPGDKMILPRLLKLESNGTLQRPGPLEVNVSMTHYENICSAIDLCIKSDRKGINIYNVADQSSYLLIDVMRELCTKLYGHKLPEKNIPVAVLKLMSLFKIGGITKLLVRSFTRDMVLDTGKIEDELGYKPVIDLIQGSDEIKEWVDSIGGIEVLKKAEKRLAWE